MEKTFRTIKTNTTIMNNVHLIYIPMTGVGLYGGYRGDAWYKERISVFKEYTLKNLQSQTNQNFLIWMSFREQEEFNPLTAELANYMKDLGVRYVLTFDGLMYYDDKFSDGFMNKAKNIGRCVRDWVRNNRSFVDVMGGIGEIYINKNKTLESRLRHSLSVLEPICKDAPWITVTRVDSDDMFHKQAVEIIQKCDPFHGALVCKKGLIYNTETNELAEWNPPTNPPFHTIFFEHDTFFNSKRYLDYFKNFKSHEDIPKIFQSVVLPDYFYCVTTHNPKNHISTIWNHPFRGKLLDPDLIHDFI
jgi:hypothetical protein